MFSLFVYSTTKTEKDENLLFNDSGLEPGVFTLEHVAPELVNKLVVVFSLGGKFPFYAQSGLFSKKIREFFGAFIGRVLI